jgi:hypothetical protein
MLGRLNDNFMGACRIHAVIDSLRGADGRRQPNCE